MYGLPLLAVVAFLVAVVPDAAASPQLIGFTAAIATTSSTSSASPSAIPTVCNNSPDLCSRAYSNITHMGAHDSAFIRDASTGNSPAGNQYFNATVALSAGIRLLQAQVHLHNGVLELCHSYCALLDAGPLSAWLARIKWWLDHNPGDVVTLLLVNADNQPAAAFATAFQSSNIASYGFAPPSSGTADEPLAAWPTLHQLIAANTRLVVFVGPLTSNPAFPYLLSEFAHVFETPYNTTSLGAFTCAADRPASAAASGAAAARAAGYLPLLNHFAYAPLTSEILLPDVDEIESTNSPKMDVTGALGAHLAACASAWGGGGDGNGNGGVGGWNDTANGTGLLPGAPVFVLVDFFDRGPAIESADHANGVVAPVGRTSPGKSAGGRSLRCRGGRLREAVLVWVGLAVLGLVVL